MDFLTGIVEGYYGRTWTWEDRLDTASFMVRSGLNSYLYCPKADAILRKRWRKDWKAADRSQLEKQARHYRDSGLNWGVGLSPYALYQDYSTAHRAELREKVRSIDALGGNLLAILFDDMPGDCPDLAARQGGIISDVVAWSAAEHLLVCPTYYSYDPVLERFFGARPDNYWEEFGRAVPESAGIMWTGNEVCSTSIDVEDIVKAARGFGRPLCLWDNYPVNDGEKSSKYIYLKNLSNRDSSMKSALTGHFCNPMNQARLSRLALSGLASLYGGEGLAAESLYSPELCRLLARDKDLFSTRGLDAIPETQRADLATEYARLEDPASVEVSDWLQGRYAFDPACLTG